jgi:hypothetical protein
VVDDVHTGLDVELDSVQTTLDVLVALVGVLIMLVEVLTGVVESVQTELDEVTWVPDAVVTADKELVTTGVVVEVVVEDGIPGWSIQNVLVFTLTTDGRTLKCSGSERFSRGNPAPAREAAAQSRRVVQETCPMICGPEPE